MNGATHAFATTASAAGTRTDLDMQMPDAARHATVVRVGDVPKPTVIVSHGAFGTGAFLLRTWGFAEAAERLDFDVVFPDGIDRQWSDGRADGQKGLDDIAFLRAVVDGIEQTIALFVQADGCNAESRSVAIARKDPSAKNSATKLARHDRRQGASLSQYRVDGRGHGVPGRAVRGVDFRGAVNLDFVAADVIMEAFAKP